MANDNSVFENSKSAPPSTNIDGKTFDAGTPAQATNDALAEHIMSQPSPTLIDPATCASSQVETARDGGGRSDAPAVGRARRGTYGRFGHARRRLKRGDVGE